MNQERLMKIVLSPHISEKTAIGTEKSNQYVFEVVQDATKPEVKAAIEHVFKTKVKNVKIMNVKAKPRRFGGIQGYHKAWKKAYVTLAEGQKIDLVGAQ